MKRNLYLFLALFAGLALAVLAQQPDASTESVKGVVQKKLAPVSKEVLRVHLPKPAERKLKNGLPVLIVEKHKLPAVQIELVIPASNLVEPSELAGLAECTAEMLRMGTKTRSARQIAEALSELGATVHLEANYGSRYTRLVATTLSENIDPLLDIIGDLLLNSTFPQEELDKWKARRISQLQQMRAAANFLGIERQRSVLYPADNRKVNAPTPASLKQITREQVIAFYKANYRPGNSLLGATGDVQTDALVKKLDQRLGTWESGDAKDPKFALDSPIKEKKVFLVNRPNSVQTVLILSNRAVDRMHPDYITTEVTNRILGGGPSGRLFVTLREEKGYTYGAYSNLTATKFLNHFTASASVRTEVTGPAIEAFLDEFQKMREQPVPPEELDNAKRALVANFALGLENQAGVLRQIMSLREYGLPADYWDTYPNKIMAVTAADVQRVAKSYVPLDNLQLIVVGDASKIRDVVSKFGPTEEYTTEGTRVTP